MNVKYIRWSFVSLLGFVMFLGVLFPTPMTLGASATWTNGKYHFAGGTHPAAIVLATLFTVMYLALMGAAPPELGEVLPGVVRRFFAFWLDFLFYFAVPLMRRRPSPGSCIAGYQVMPDEGRTLTLWRAILRTIVGFVAMSMWPLTPFIARQRKKGKVWFDGPFRTHAVILR